MISSIQLEAFYERYQREGVPNDLSMQPRLLGKVDSLTKALEDKSHQLTNWNRNKFGTKTNRKIINN